MAAMMQARTDSPWQEQGALPGAVVLTVDAINQDEQDKLELENFARGLSAPAKEDAGGKAFRHHLRGRARAAQPMSPKDAIRLVLGFAFGGLTWLATDSVVRDGLSTGLSVAAFVFGLGLLSIVDLVRASRAAPVARSTRGVFELRFDAGHFACSGAGVPEVRFELARVRSFTGNRRLSIELTDAPAATLPLSVPSKNNGALAARLNDLLAASRASSSRAW
jgi:hypothetical protein